MFRPIAWLSILLTVSGIIIFPTGRVCAGTLSEQLISAAELGEIDKVKGFLDQGVPVEASRPILFVSIRGDSWTSVSGVGETEQVTR